MKRSADAEKREVALIKTAGIHKNELSLISTYRWRTK